MTSTRSSSGRRGTLSGGKPASKRKPTPSPGSAARKAPKARGARSLTMHDFGVAFRGVLPILVVALVTFIVLMPVSTAAIPDASIFNLDYTHDQLKWRFWNSEMLYPVYFGVVLFGCVLGVRSFRFLLVKCETTALLSLPLGRTTLFFTRMAACLIALVVGIGVPLTISLGVNIAALGVWDGIFSDFAFVLCGLVLLGLLCCLVAALSSMLAGTVVEACTFLTALLSCVTVGAWGLNALMKQLLVGNAFDAYFYNGTTAVASSLVDATASVNPLLFFLSSVQGHYLFMVKHPVYYPASGDWGLLGIWLCVTCALALLAAILIHRRRGERAGVAGLNVPLTFVVGLVVGLAAFGATFTLLASVDVAAAIVAAFGAFLVVSLVLFRGPLRGNTRLSTTLGVVAVGAVCLGGVVAIVATGGLGYSSYVPEASQVASVEVSYTGEPDYLAVKFDSASAGSGSYYYSATYTLEEPDDIAAVADVHAQLVQTGRASLARDRMDFGRTVVPYDVRIRYTMADGSTVVRYYDRATYDELYAIAQLDASDEISELQRATITSDVSGISASAATAVGNSSAHQAYLSGSVYLSDPYYASPVLLTCTEQAKGQLLAALADDVSRQSVEDRYHPSATARGILMFTQSGTQDAQSFSYSLSNTVIYLTDEFTETLAWLDENGLSGYLAAKDSSVIESLTFQRYDPYAGMNKVTKPFSVLFKGYRSTNASSFIVTQDFGTKYATTDAGELAELIPLLRNTYYMDGGGYLVQAKLGGVNAYAYYFLPDSAVPEWLLRVAG